MSRHGAVHLGDEKTRFQVWAPGRGLVTLVLEDGRTHELEVTGGGYHGATVHGAPPGTRYRYLLDGEGPFADPASRSQPLGVHGPSEVVERRRPVDSRWRAMPLSAQVICELHVGTYSPQGTFAGVVDSLEHIASAGYTAIELMPVAQFAGERNWGYDGVFPHAVQSSYGGPSGLASLTQAAHERGLAVVVDVVYNHIGPEGSVHDEYGPYLTDRYATPWGRALNFDGPGSDAVRAYFIEAACYLVRELGVDGLRLDAVHEIVDLTASPFLAELTSAIGATGRSQARTITVVAESPANDPRLTTPVSAGGLGCGASWDDDFHHALRVTLTGKRDRWFADFQGIDDLAIAMTRGWVLTGRESANFGRRHGVALPAGFSGDRLVAYAQNHDQIGNAGYGRRLTSDLPLEAQYPVAAAVLLSPFVPLRFMGEEYGETAPFFYFTSHTDEQLAVAVRRGRAAEVGDHGPAPPDPQDPATFEASRPERALVGVGIHRDLLAWQSNLLALRREHPALGSLEPGMTRAAVDQASGTLSLVRRADRYLDAPEVAVILRLSPPAQPGEEPATVALPRLGGRCWEIAAARGAPELEAGCRLDWNDARPELSLERYAAVVLVQARDATSPSVEVRHADAPVDL
ncbi:MAG: malto-oligosyltrehalose trehalohydrolase [Acidimicrobiaceae bacterium]|nr:malto-oligosyltrehalose trehalohydrolase [Acidimicrobiaceae bacterium]